MESVEIILVPLRAHSKSQGQKAKEDGKTNSAENDSIGTSGSDRGTGSSGGNGGWLSSGSWFNLQSIVLRAGLNMTITIKNLLIKYIDDDGVLMIGLDKLQLKSINIEEWEHLVDNPDAWLRKDCTIKGLSINCERTVEEYKDLSAIKSNESMNIPRNAPLLRMGNLRLSGLVPAFAYVEGEDIGNDDFKISLDLDINCDLSLSLNDWQLSWMGSVMHHIRNLDDGQPNNPRDGRQLSGSCKGLSESSLFVQNMDHTSSKIDEALEDTDTSKSKFNSKVFDVVENEKIQDEVTNIHDTLVLENEIPYDMEGAVEVPVFVEVLFTISSLHMQLGVVSIINLDEHMDKMNDHTKMEQGAKQFENRKAVTLSNEKLVSTCMIVHPFVDIRLDMMHTHLASVNKQLHHLHIRSELINVHHNNASRSYSDSLLLPPTIDVNKMSFQSIQVDAMTPAWEEILSIKTVPGRLAGLETHGDVPQHGIENIHVRSALELIWKSETLSAATVDDTDNKDENSNPSEQALQRCQVFAGVVSCVDESQVRDKIMNFLNKYVEIFKGHCVSTQTEVYPNSISIDDHGSGCQGDCVSKELDFDKSTLVAEAFESENRNAMEVNKPWWYSLGGLDLNVYSLNLISRHEYQPTQRSPFFSISVGNTSRKQMYHDTNFRTRKEFAMKELNRLADSEPESHTVSLDAPVKSNGNATENMLGCNRGIEETLHSSKQSNEILQTELENLRRAYKKLQEEKISLESQLNGSQNAPKSETQVNHNVQDNNHQHPQIAPKVPSGKKSPPTIDIVDLSSSSNHESGSKPQDSKQKNDKKSNCSPESHRRTWSLTESLASSWIYFLQSEVENPKDSSKS